MERQQTTKTNKRKTLLDWFSFSSYL